MAILIVDYTTGEYRMHQSVRHDGTIVVCPVCNRIGAILRDRPTSPADTQLTITHTVKVYTDKDSPAHDHSDVRVLTDQCTYDPPTSAGGASAKSD